TLETQEGQLRDFRLKHVGEMPEQQVATLTVLGQLRASLQQEGEALARAEQQRSYLQTMMTGTVPVVDVDAQDAGEIKAPVAPAPKSPGTAGPPIVSSLAEDKTRLAALLAKYTESHPEIRKLRAQIADREAKQGAAPAPVQTAAALPEPPVPPPPAKKRAPM